MLIRSLETFFQVIDKGMISTIENSFNFRQKSIGFILTIDLLSYYSINLHSYLIYNIFIIKLSYEDTRQNVSNQFRFFNAHM